MHQYRLRRSKFLFQERRVFLAIVDVRIDEIMDHFYLGTFAPKRPTRLLTQVLGDCRYSIRFLNRELGDRVKRRILTDDRYVGPVKSGNEVNVLAGLAQHLARNPGAGRVGDRVVAVQ